MKYFLISDNRDTLTGMRLAGIKGVVVHEYDETEKALNQAVSNPEYGIILITSTLAERHNETINKIRLTPHSPLLVTIPDRHGQDGREMEMLLKYLNESIGIKI